MAEAILWLLGAVVLWLLLVVAIGISADLLLLWSARRIGIEPGRELFWLRRLVAVMESACDLIDRIPWWLRAWNPLRWLGCPRGLALWSSELDERWQTGVWEPAGNKEEASDG